MRMDTPVANGDPTLAALIPEGVTLAHIIDAVPGCPSYKLGTASP